MTDDWLLRVISRTGAIHQSGPDYSHCFHEGHFCDAAWQIQELRKTGTCVAKTLNSRLCLLGGTVRSTVEGSLLAVTCMRVGQDLEAISYLPVGNELP